MHSPHVFTLITEVFNDDKEIPVYKVAEALRKKMLKDPRVLEVKDLGAGSVSGKHPIRSVASIAANAAKPPGLGQLLHRLVAFYEPALAIELGTSLGVTSTYLALALKEYGGSLITVEGSPAIAAVARENLRDNDLDNVVIEEGNFDKVFPHLLANLRGPGTRPLAKPDPLFVFIDGNHREHSTIKYFGHLLAVVRGDTVLVFDDIHWSPGMERAWDTIRNHPKVRCSIDLFFMGIVLFRPEFREPQHFDIRF